MGRFLISLLLFFIFLHSYLCADLPGFPRRIEVTIENSGAYDFNNYPVRITINTLKWINRGNMQADGDDLRLTDGSDNLLPFWLGKGINTESTDIYVRLPSIPPGSTQTVNINFGNPAASSVSDLPSTSDYLECGIVSSLDENWQAVTFTESFALPPNILATPYTEGGEEASVRIRNVTRTSFEIRLDNPDDQAFPLRSASWLALPGGEYSSFGGMLIESRNITTDRQVGNNDGIGDSFEQVNFNTAFSSAPIVFAQLNTNNDNQYATEVVQNVSAGSCNVSVDLMEVNYGDHAAESIAVMALSYPLRDESASPAETLTGSMNGRDDNSSGYYSAFQDSFQTTPLVLADMQTRNGNNGGFLAVRNISTDGVWVYTEEDSAPANGGGRDTERNHTGETAGVFALADTGPVPIKEQVPYEPTVTTGDINDKLVFVNGNQSIDQGNISQMITLEYQDAFNQTVNVTSDLNINLKGTSSDIEFSLTDSPFTAMADPQVTIPAGSSSVSFFVRGNTSGEYKITGAENPPLDITDPITAVTFNDISAAGTFVSEVVIDNSSGPALTDQQVLLNFDSSSLISQGVMKADGSDIRFFTDDTLTTAIPYWIEGGINTANTRIWLKLSAISSGSLETVYMSSNNPVSLPASRYQGVMIPMESGSVMVSDSWISILTNYEYNSPVIIALSDDTGGAAEEASVRIRNVSSTSFEIKLTNPSENSLGAARKITYIVVEEGDHMLPGGYRLSAGQYQENRVIGRNSGDNTYSSVTFSSPFSASPDVFTQTASFNDSAWCSEHIINPSPGSFQNAMERGELSGGHQPETMHWLAVDSGIQVITSNNFLQTMRTANNIQGHDNGCYINNFPASFSTPPLVVADMVTRNGGDGGFITLCAVTNQYAGLHVDEEDESDNERSHTTETASVIAIENEGVFPLHKRADPMPQAFLRLTPARIVFTTLPQTITVGRRSELFTVEFQDIAGNPAPVTIDTNLLLTSSSAGGSFSLSADFSAQIQQITVTAGDSSASFYYRDDFIGIYTLTVSETPDLGYGDASQQVVVQDILTGAYRYDIEIDNSSCPYSYSDFQVPLIINTQNFISAGKMEADGRDIRFFESDGITPVPYWIETGINTANTVIWLKVADISAGAVTRVEMHYGNPAMTDQSSIKQTMENAETGSVISDGAWQDVIFSGVYRDPVVIATHIEGSDGMEVAPRIRALGASSMQVNLIRPEVFSFTPARVNYFVCESGYLTTLAGSRIFADNFNENIVIGRRTGNNSLYHNYIFSDSSYFIQPPLVFAQVLSNYDSSFITDHVRSPSTNGFSIALEAAEAVTAHNSEDMGIIAIENGISESLRGNNNIYLETGRTADNVSGHDNGWRSVFFSSAFSAVASTPSVISDMQSRDGADGGWAVTDTPTSSGFRVHVEEDRVNDSERSHTTEVVAWSGFSESGFIPLRKYSPCSIGADLSGIESLNIVRLEFDILPLTIAQGETSSLISVYTRGADGTAIPVQDTVNVNLTANSSTAEFSDDGINWNNSLSLTFSPGEDSESFYFRDRNSGTKEIRATETPSRGWADALGIIDVLKRKLTFIQVPQNVRQGEVSELIILQSQSASGTPVVMSEDTVVSLSSTSGQGEFSLTNEPFTTTVSVIIPAGSAEVNLYYRDKTQGTHILRASEVPEKGWDDAAQEITVLPADSYFVVETLPSVYSGADFQLLVTAYNNDGSIKTDYQGEIKTELVAENESEVTQELAILTEGEFIKGQKSITMRYNDAVRGRILCSDIEIPEINGLSDEILFLPYIFVLSRELIRDQVVNDPVELSVNAVNIFGNKTPGFNRSVNLSSFADSSFFEPKSIVFSGGSFTGFISSNEWGERDLILTDPLNNDSDQSDRNKTGSLFFHASTFVIQIEDPPGARDFYYTDENFKVYFKAVDAEKNIITSFNGDVQLDSGSNTLSGKGVFKSEDILIGEMMELSFSDSSEGSATIKVQENGYAPSETISSAIEFRKGFIKIDNVSGPVGSLNLKVQIIDSEGSIITGDSTTKFKIQPIEDFADNSFSSDAISDFKEFSRGVAFIDLNNTQAEKVRIDALSEPELEVIPGEAVFMTGGVQIQEGGIRIDYWREIKD